MWSAIFVGVGTAAAVFWLCAKVFDMPVIGFFIAVGMGLYGALKAGGGPGAEPEPEPGPGGVELRMGFRVDPSAGQSSAGPDAGTPNMFDVPDLMRLGRWDEARRAMQKLAFGMPREPADVQAQFKKLAVEFASVDPFYSHKSIFVLHVVREGQPIRQAEIYEYLDHMSKEDVRYVLYFAEQLGQVVRTKKGNSYILTMPQAATT